MPEISDRGGYTEARRDHQIDEKAETGFRVILDCAVAQDRARKDLRHLLLGFVGAGTRAG